MSETAGNPKVRVGFIGVGVMGRPMASNLIKAGYSCAVYDVNPIPVQTLVAEGAVAPGNVEEIARNSDVLIGMVVNDAQFSAILFEPGNAARSLKAGSIVIGMSTMSRASVKELAERLQKSGIGYIDAPVSGGEVGAIAGNLSIMAGAPDELMERCLPLFEVMGKVFHVGKEAGDGQAVKMVNQLMVGTHLVVAAEALTLGEKLGLDKAMLLEIISQSAGSSWVFQNRGPRMVAGDFDPPKSAMAIFVKDLGFVMDNSNKLGHPLLMAGLAHQLFKMAAAQGMATLDDSAIIKLIQELSGLGKNTP